MNCFCNFCIKRDFADVCKSIKICKLAKNCKDLLNIPKGEKSEKSQQKMCSFKLKEKSGALTFYH